MVEPLLLGLLPDDSEIEAVAKQFVEMEGEIYNAFISACKTMLEIVEPLE